MRFASLRIAARRALLCVALAGVASGCTKVNTGPNGTGEHYFTKPGLLRIAIQTPPNNLNPILSSNTTESMVDRLMFDTLVTVDPQGHELPDLASVVPTVRNGGISADGKTIVYHLRRGVRWHDGVPFTSEDVAFSLRAVMNPANNVISRTGYELVDSLATPDAATVVVRLKKRFAPFVDTFFGESDSPYLIVPAHVLAKAPNFNAVPFDSAPIGTGPFKFREWARGDHIELVPNDAYFLGKPKLSKIRIVFSPDENTEVNQLQTHEVDWQFEASPKLYGVLQSLSDTRIVLQDRNGYERLEMNDTSPALRDVRVRRAIAYAVDVRRLTDGLTGGSATPADQDLPPFMWAHARDVTHYPPDVAEAKRLLAEAGYVPGPDGVLTKNGQRLSLTFVTNNTNSTRILGVVQVQGMLRAVGIDAQTKLYQGALLFAPMGADGVLQNGRFDIAWTGWIAGIDPDNSSLFTCAARPPNGNNTIRYCNPDLDAAEAVALGSASQAVRTGGYARVEKILSRDVPYLPIWWPRQIQPINPDFKHFNPNPVTASWNAYQWEI